MQNRIIKLIGLLLLSASFTSVHASDDTLEVCGVPQVYSAVEGIRENSEISFNSYFGTMQDIESRAIYYRGKCNVIITNEERLPANLIKEGKITQNSVARLVKAPLILWSNNKFLLKDNVNVIVNRKLKSLALPKDSLTTVGFAATEVVKRKDFPSEYLKKKNAIYRAEHEYQIFSLLKNNNIQTGFITKPLIMKNGETTGSYWYVPHEYYSPVYYYIISTDKSDKTQELYNYIRGNKKNLSEFYSAGFEALNN